MDASDTTRKIFDLLAAHRRRHPSCAAAPDEAMTVFGMHGPVIERFVREGQPLHAILPAFPCKSPSSGKVLGRLPDRAERQSLVFLDELFRDIAVVHPPGARLTICSDGRVFAECLDVPDADISAYRDALAAMCVEEGLRHIDFFQLEDVPAYAGLKDDPRALRAALERDFGMRAEAMRETLLATPQGTAMYTAVTRFMREDRADEAVTMSGTQAQKYARSRALWTIACSEAWGRLLAVHWPDALRLSIHPQMPDSPKLGIRLLDTPDDWLTPWHATLLDDQGHARLVHRGSVDECCLVRVEEDGRPSYLRRPRLSEAVRHARERDVDGLEALPGAPAFGACWTARDVAMPDVAVLAGWVRRHGLVLLRGLPPLDGIEAMADLAGGFGALLPWPEGPVVEIAEGDDPGDHVASAQAMPMHWDGMFLPQVPELLAFACRAATPGRGGRTLFTWTPGVLHDASADLRERWESMVGHYGLATATFAGRVRAPLVQRHPVHGYPVIRYCGPYAADAPNPATRRFGGHDGEALASLDAMLSESSYVYAHDWQEGDLLIADNFAVLHGREAFASGAGRRLWRAHVHATGRHANADLVRGVAAWLTPPSQP